MPKKITGRTKQLSLKTTPAFHAKLKELAVKEKCLMIEVLEKAVMAWEERERKMSRTINKRSLSDTDENVNSKKRRVSDY